jgi:hypothetical protein
MWTVHREKLNWVGYVLLTLVLAGLDWICLTISRDGSHIPTLRPLCGIAAGLCLSSNASESKKIILATTMATILARLFTIGLGVGLSVQAVRRQDTIAPS